MLSSVPAEAPHSSPEAGPSSPSPPIGPFPPSPEASLYPSLLRLDPKGKGKEREILLDTRGQATWYRAFRTEEEDLSDMERLCEQELSEPYNIFCFRYFLTEWPHLTFLAYGTPTSEQAIACIICKQEPHRGTIRGYIGMLCVDRPWRRRGIARRLVQVAIEHMKVHGAEEVVLETEFDNTASLALYDSLGFVRAKRLHAFYSNRKDAFRLILPLRDPPDSDDDGPEETDEDIAAFYAFAPDRYPPPSSPHQMPAPLLQPLPAAEPASDPPPPPLPPRPPASQSSHWYT